MQIGDVITRTELTWKGWKKLTVIMKGSAEIWTKLESGATYEQRIIWRVKYSKIYLMWDRQVK